MKHIPSKSNPQYRLLIRYLSILVLFISFFSVDQWSSTPLSNFPMRVILWTMTIVSTISFRKYIVTQNDWKLFLFLNLYIAWTIICIVRGFFSYSNFIEFRHLIFGIFACILPLFVWLFNKADIISYINRFWFKFGLVAFGIFFYWTVGFTQFYLSPLLLLFCFFPLFSKKKAIFIFCLALIYCYVGGLETRAQLGKGSVALLVGITCYYSDYISCKLYKIFHFCGYLSIILVFGVILSDFYGLIFGKTSPNEVDLGADKAMVDSRSLLYLDVIDSSIDHNYVIQGRTPARGHDIIYSGVLFYREEQDFNDYSRNERHFDEMLFPNIYTWEGIIGVILLSLIYLKASILAVYRSKNNYIKLLGCFIAFRWTFGWIEDTSEFNISSVSLWCMIGMCYSSQIRNMDKMQFKQWIQTLF